MAMLPRSMKQSSESTYGCDEVASALLDEIDEESHTVREVLRIKRLLDARHEHSENLLFESLRLLQLMELPAHIIKATNIATSVNCFLKDTSERIRKFAHLLVTGWEFLLNKWMADTRATFDLYSAREEELPFDIGDLIASQTSTFDLTNFFDGMIDEGSPSRREQKRTGKNIEVLKRSIHKPQGTFIMSYRDELPSETESCLKVLPKSGEKAGGTIQLKTVKNSITKPQVTSKPGGNPASTEPAKSVLLKRSTDKLSRNLKPIQVCKRASPKILPRVTGKPEGLTYKEKLEISKRKLRENYEDAENVKKKRRVVMIDLKSIPMQRHKQERHKRNRGCHINKFATTLPKHNHVSFAW
ncbi:uncharacterized protein A4U43_C02F19540 [Asparagus officinalis]|uniref:TFIIS N-terminal domain-containing protein n=1 Tax=Asparagus officinalis TaxID=4686 RepID=A0A5P1FPE1_ASPOF|nr:uncharacterized protein LOC109831695 [Asparagus officinalis]ONK78510.1 uncharacterized protein A4U43_C02F19540 [Asparagus officinalis]